MKKCAEHDRCMPGRMFSLKLLWNGLKCWISRRREGRTTNAQLPTSNFELPIKRGFDLLNREPVSSGATRSAAAGGTPFRSGGERNRIKRQAGTLSVLIGATRGLVEYSR